MEKELRKISLNSQGLEGAWRLLHMVVDGNPLADVLTIQEVSATETQWKGMARFMSRHGYRGFYTPGCVGAPQTSWRCYLCQGFLPY